MSNTLFISFKATAEHFDIPCRSQTTIHELIEYVCKYSTIVLNINPNDYYLAIYNSYMLDDSQTVEEASLNQTNQIYSLHVCNKTEILMKRILQSLMQLYHDLVGIRVLHKTQQITINKLSNNTDHLAGWLRNIEQNRQFWLNKQEELYKLTGKPHKTCLSEMI